MYNRLATVLKCDYRYFLQYVIIISFIDISQAIQSYHVSTVCLKSISLTLHLYYCLLFSATECILAYSML